MLCIGHGIVIALWQRSFCIMEIWNKIFEWGVLAISGAAVVFAVLAVLSLVFDGFLDKLSSLLRKSQHK